MRYSGFRLAIAGSRANDTPRQTAHPPKCRPIQPKRPFFAVFHPMGLHFGDHTTSNRGHTATNRGNCAIQASDTPATRRQRASHGAKPPPPLVWRARATSKTGTVPIGAKILAQHGPSSGSSAKKLAEQAQKRQIWGVLSAQGELFRAFAMAQRRRANFFMPK